MVYTVPIYVYAVSLYMYTLLLYSVECSYAYSHYSAAIYSTDTVPQYKVTLCSPYTVLLYSINTVSLISLKLYSVPSVTIHAYSVTIHVYNVTMQCTHAISIYSVDAHFPCKICTVSLCSVTIQFQCHYKGYIQKLYM